MIYINDKPFYDKPGSCGTCPFYQSDGSELAPSDRGFCPLFDENHRSWINLPSRCSKLFNKALKFPDGVRLVIVKNSNY